MTEPDATPDAPDTPDAEPERFTPLSWGSVQAIMAGRIKAPLPEDFNGVGFAPTQPTTFRPGTPGKIAALAARYARRERLFHPRDAK